MSPALINQAPAYSQNPSVTHGKISHPSSFNCPEFSQENPSKFHRSYSSIMTPTNAGDDTSGFPSISPSRSGLSRPRLPKVKRGSSSRNLGSTTISEGQDSLEVNQFRNIRENLVTASSRAETGPSVAAESWFGKIGNDAFVFGADRTHLHAKFNNLNAGETLIGGVAEELKNLRIKNDNVSKGGVLDSNSRDESGKETCVFGVNMKDCANVSDFDSSVTNRKGILEHLKNLKIGNSGEFVNAKGGAFDPSSSGKLNSNVATRTVHSHSSSIDENTEDKLPEDMSRLKIESHMNEDGRETVKDGKFVSSAKDKLGSSNNVTGSLEKNLESELPDELQKKLNLKETGQMGATNVIFNDVDMYKFEFGRSRKDDDPSVKSIENTLHSHMKNLNIKDYLNTNNENNLASSKTVDVKKETIMSRNKKCSSDAFAKDMPSCYVGDILSFNHDKSKEEEFTFHGGTQVKHPSGGSKAPSDQPKDDVRVRGNAAASSSFSSSGISLEKIGCNFEVPRNRDEYTVLNNQSCLGTPFEFKTPNQKMNIISNSNEKLEFSVKRDLVRDARMKKRGGKSRHPTKVHLCHGQDFVLRGGNSKEDLEGSDPYSPMDISPYQEILADNQYARENSVTSDESSSCNLPTDSVPTNSVDAVDEDVLMATDRLDINERSVSMAETESFKSAMEDVDFISDNLANSVEMEASSRSNVETHYNDCRTQFCFASSSEDIKGSNFTFSASSSTQGQSTASKRLNRKKSLAKLGQDVNLTIPFSGSSALLSPGRNQRGDPSPRPWICGDDRGGDKGQAVKQEYVSTFSAAAAAQEACEKWRSRGNQAYTAGELSKAENCYTQGVNCVSRGETSKSCLRALMLCYSNRAATRMSLGRMRDALSDCVLSSEIDPNFLKVQLRAANCYLALGEVEDASQHFKRCLQPGSDVCVDQKMAVEASNGLLKVQKVYECRNTSTELLQRKTSNVGSALELIAEALIISPFSEELLEMKAEALFMIRSYEEAIGLCEQTFDSAEKNSRSLAARENSANLDRDRLLKYFYFRFWRSQIILKCYFHLGRLEDGLASLEKQEEKLPVTNDSKILESSLPLAVTVCELLRYKAAGNEAFQAGRHMEAVEHYTAALSCSVESRPFAAVCFCNRAAAYKALGQITDAIADCSLAMALDRNYGKAISRRATLFEMIRDYGQVVTDLRRLASLLNKQVEQKTGQLGGCDRSLNYGSDLRQVRIRLSEIEEEARRDIPLDMYLILGVEPFSSASEIKKAYRKAALRHHPDKASQFMSRSDNGDDGLWKEIAEEVYRDADRLFKMIGEAYAVLSDPTKRTRYDCEEEMRNAQKKRNGSSSSRPPADVQNYPFDRSGNRRQWNDIRKPYGKSTSREAEATWSSRYS